MRFAVPNALAIIPDGNRRWAKKHRLSILKGYSVGVNRFIDFTTWCADYGINSVTVWALSSENLQRQKHEVNTLLNIYKRVATDKKILKRLKDNQIKVNIIANKNVLPMDVIKALKNLEKETMHYTKRVINMLIGYGGRDDILYAAKQLALEGDPRKINEDNFEKHLMSRKVPTIDFVIRTSGEERLSGFMPWQAGYAELYFSKKLWPDFTRNDLSVALANYNKRDRRFGK
ncbi:MAG: di-trans,poly-cis-decaprenylcistransferase [Candidatus Micrarchaeota archaeon]|nr:di-trans,poly-cis-decaprenylcistransferase [Candidatus Micrarchaeota archaeon]